MHKRFRRTDIILVGLVVFLVGLVAGRLATPVPLLWSLVPGIFLLGSLPKRSIISILAVAVFGLSLGLWRGSTFAQKLLPYKALNERRVSVEVEARTDGVYSDKGQLSFDAANIVLLDPIKGELPGVLKIEGFGASAVYRGDIVHAEGKLFQTRGSKQANIGFADIQVVSRNDDVINKIRREFVAGMETALPEPQASFGLGLLIGQRSTLPKDITDELSVTGLTHIIAVSGYNLTILVLAVRQLTGKRSKYQSTVLSILLIVGFLLITGFSASIVRAAIVSGLSLWAWYYGRTIRPLLLIALAAAITAAWYPLYLWTDIGWYLSFLAFFGVLVIAPLLVGRLSRSKEPKILLLIVAETLCAQLMTIPLILFIFNDISLISLISNVLIVPLVPLAMLASLIAGLAGMFVPVISSWLALPARILLTYMLDMVSLLAGIPRALIRRSISLQTMLGLYAAILAFTAALWRSVRVSKRKTSL